MNLITAWVHTTMSWMITYQFGISDPGEPHTGVGSTLFRSIWIAFFTTRINVLLIQSSDRVCGRPSNPSCCQHCMPHGRTETTISSKLIFPSVCKRREAIAGIPCHIRVIYHIPMLAMGMICINARHHNDFLIHFRSLVIEQLITRFQR